MPAAGRTVGSSDVNANGTAALPANTWTFPDGDLRRVGPAALRQRDRRSRSTGSSGALRRQPTRSRSAGTASTGSISRVLIDEVRVYNVALTPLQIQSDMNRPIETGATMDTQPPTAPTNLTATASGNQVSLSWTASTDNVGVTGYLVYRENPGSSTFVQVGTATGTTFTDASAPRAGHLHL